MSILVVGSVALDTVRTPKGLRREVLGGSATYFSVSARNFSRVRLVAVVGEDFPARHVRFLKRRGIDVDGLQIRKGKTFRWEGAYGKDFGDPKTLATELNVFSEFNPRIPKQYRDSRNLFLANIDPDLQKRVLGQLRDPRLVVCDTMNYWIENKRRALLSLLKHVDIFLVNESEARALTGENGIANAAQDLLRLGPEKVIIKKGEHGCILFSRDGVFSAPAFLMQSVTDPTGAGDTFAGGVVGFLSTQKGRAPRAIRKAIVYGSIMATFAVEDFSLGRLGSVGRTDIERRLRGYVKMTRL